MYANRNPNRDAVYGSGVTIPIPMSRNSSYARPTDTDYHFDTLFRGDIADSKNTFAGIRTAVVQLTVQLLYQLRCYGLIYLKAEITFFALQ